jgi:hypothetical protein
VITGHLRVSFLIWKRNHPSGPYDTAIGKAGKSREPEISLNTLKFWSLESLVQPSSRGTMSSHQGIASPADFRLSLSRYRCDELRQGALPARAETRRRGLVVLPVLGSTIVPGRGLFGPRGARQICHEQLRHKKIKTFGFMQVA